LTGRTVVTSTEELLTAVAHLSDDELHLLGKLAWRLANEFSEESPRPRVVEVIRRCGVVLTEEQDRRRSLLDHGDQQSSDGGRAVCLLRDRYDREGLNDPCTD
jgi:hypothetical protein